MRSKKITGSYYTPKILSDFLIKHIFTNYIHRSELAILEPSCGDGQFLSSLFEHIDLTNYNINLTICDKDFSALQVASQLVPKVDKIDWEIIHDDYLNFFLNSNKQFSLIMGNPPYIRKKYMEFDQIERSERIHRLAKEYSIKIKSDNKINNLWTAFVEAAVMSLDDHGVICFVLPAEIMHVDYTKELRGLVQSEFQRIDVFAFNELLFDGIEQDVIALVGVKGVEKREQQGVSFYQVENLNDLKKPRYTEHHSNIHRLTLEKWTNYILSDDDLNFINTLKESFNPLKAYCERAQVGITTAANDFFILNKNETMKHGLHQVPNLITPIISKSAIMPNVLDFRIDDYEALLEHNKTVCFVQFSDVTKNQLTDVELNYIDFGENNWGKDNEDLRERFKMKKRNNWYSIPGIWCSEGFFAKRAHYFPRIFVNTANSLVTDSFYRITTNEHYNIYNLAFCFNNSLTFVLAEIEGRFYGGGVLELTPNEFKNLSIPYSHDITVEQFEKLDAMIRNSNPIDDILDFTDNILFRDVEIDIPRLREIRKRLVNRRIKSQN